MRVALLILLLAGCTERLGTTEVIECSVTIEWDPATFAVTDTVFTPPECREWLTGPP